MKNPFRKFSKSYFKNSELFYKILKNFIKFLLKTLQNILKE